jgi:uncharacterized membrane protein YfcA
MFAVGILIGFIGAGGAGVMVTILTLVFDLPIHTAVGTALAAMLFTTISGSISHYREGNVVIGPGIVIGVGGMTGAVLGANLSQSIPEHILQPMAGAALWFLAFLVWLRMRLRNYIKAHPDDEEYRLSAPQLASGAGAGVLGGIASSFFGVGMAPFVQLALMTVMRLPLIQALGTTMLSLAFISLTGSLALASHGDVSLIHTIGVTIGMTAGSYVGAKFTRRAPINVLRFAVVATPFVAGTLLIVA